MVYEYKMVQIPKEIAVKEKEYRGNEAASYLQHIVSQNSSDGWEFYRVDTIGVVVKAGCLASLFGQKESFTNYYVVSFRKEKR